MKKSHILFTALIMAAVVMPSLCRAQETGGNPAAAAAYWEGNSDVRQQGNVMPLEKALDKVLQMRGMSFVWRDARTAEQFGIRPQIGLLVEDIERLYPEAVSVDASGQKIINHALLVPPLVEALKGMWAREEEMIKHMRALEDRTAELEDTIKGLKFRNDQMVRQLEEIEESL